MAEMKIKELNTDTALKSGASGAFIQHLSRSMRHLRRGGAYPRMVIVHF